MKRLLTLATVALVAVPLFAAEEKKQDAAPADSPMVAAAKRTNRAASKRVVITNEALKDSKGHITTTTIVTGINVPPPKPSPEVQHNDRLKKEAENAAKQAEADKKKEAAKKEREARLAAAAESLEGGYSDADPATAEGTLSEATAKPEPKKP